MATTVGEMMKVLRPGKQPVPKLSQPAPIQPIEPVPALLRPDPIHTLEPAPKLSRPGIIEPQPAPALYEPPPPPPHPPVPELSAVSPIPFEPPPALLVPTPPGTQVPPALSQPLSVPFEPPPSLSVPAVIGPEAPPALITPTPVVFQPPPAASVPAQLTAEPAPRLLQPAPVNDKGGTKFYEPSALLKPLEETLGHQIDYFKKTLPQTLANLAQRSLPKPGNIDPDLMPSTIFTKALNVANGKIQELENTYGYDDISNAGSKVSSFLGSAMGVNYAPEGAVENSPKLASLRKIDAVLRKNPENSLGSLFEPKNKGKLRSDYIERISMDQKYIQLDGSAIRYRTDLDGSEGLLPTSMDVPAAAKNSYFPFYLVDLRPNRDRKYRTIFFQPINLELSENFSPSWNAQNFMGRVDPVATYQNTTRALQVSFKMVALHPADLQIIYGKLKWLAAMVYPEYSPNMRYKSGPICKLRIGNVINASSPSIPLSSERPGVAGFISSLDYNYDKVWELENDWQVPRNIDVSFGFTVLHELPVGLLDGEFGTVGSIDEKGIFSSPQAEIDSRQVDNSDDMPAASSYVDTRGFRSVGPDKQKNDAQDGEGF